MKRTILGAGFLTGLFGLPLALTAPVCAAEINQASAQDADRATQDQAGPSVPVYEPQFTKVIDDLPLMPGLQLVDDEDVLFSEPGAGRIAETNAVGNVDIDQVYNFYRHSLPHLGWKMVNTHLYEREGEQLHITARANNKITLVQFSVKPLHSEK